MTQSMAFVLCQQQEQKGSKRSISRRRMVTRRGWWLTGGPKVPPTSAPPPPHWSISGRTSDSRRDMHSILCKEIKNLYKLCTMNEQQQSRSRAESVPVPVPVPVAVAAQGGKCVPVSWQDSNCRKLLQFASLAL